MLKAQNTVILIHFPHSQASNINALLTSLVSGLCSQVKSNKYKSISGNILSLFIDVVVKHRRLVRVYAQELLGQVQERFRIMNLG